MASSGKDKKEYFEETETRSSSSKKSEKASEKRKHTARETRKNSARSRTGSHPDRREYAEKTARSKMPAESQRYDETETDASPLREGSTACRDGNVSPNAQDHPSGGHGRKKKLRKKAV